MPQPTPISDPSSIDVVIVNYNAGTLLADCIGSLLASAHPVAHIIVVDNASHDASLATLAQAFPAEPRLVVIRNQHNVGFSAACNIGARASTASQLLFLNPDTTIAPDAIGRLRDVLQSRPDIGMVGGLLCHPDGSEQPGGRRRFPTPGRAFTRAFGLSRLARLIPGLSGGFDLHETPLPTQPTPIEAISGACMLVKREAVDAVGLWDEGYFLHCEDLDWCMRFHQLGWAIVFVPDARVYHAWRACSRSRPFFVEWHKHRGMLRFYRKFYRAHYPGVLMWLVAAGVWLRFGAVAAVHALKLGAQRARSSHG